MTEINKENLLKVVEALRSGDYEQGRGRLATITADGTVKFCCLGVFCEVALLNGVEMVVTEGVAPGDPRLNRRSYDNEALFLPAAVSQWLVRDGAAAVSNLVIQGYGASTLNDEFGWTFDQIADGLVETYELEEGDEPPAGQDRSPDQVD